jgi:S1-C subfamily serine protease
MRPQLGIFVDDRINRQFTRQMDVEGLMILGVRPGSPAESDWLKPGNR